MSVKKTKWKEGERTLRCLSLRNSQGRPLKVVREVYLRADVPCYSPKCEKGCAMDTEALLPDCSTYIVPDCQVAKDFLELFELPDVQGVVFTQTAANYVQHEGSRRLADRLRQLVRTPGTGCVQFCNEFQRDTHCLQESHETVAEWRTRSTFRTAEWFFNHLKCKVTVVMVTGSEETASVFRRNKKVDEEDDEEEEKKKELQIRSLQQYIAEFWASHEAISHLHTSLSEAAAATKEVSKRCSSYLPQTVLQEGLKTGRFVSGRLNVNRFNASTEAFVARSGVDLTDESRSDILVVGSKDRNRAIHGDEVVVEIFPRSQWRVRSLAVNIAEENEVEDEVGNEDNEKRDKSSSEKRLPTGHVVGILRRQWRDCVASLSPDEAENKHSTRSGKILVIPWDYRIPKIRIATRQVDIIKEQRCLVRIDNWPADSQYPNGHLVKALGPIGDLETEIAALLVENELTPSAFTPAQLAEMPTDSDESPWQMSDEEVKRRRDLRQSHLVFSIDPKGCEDVDDTLSLRKLDNGNLELGVHIADVTYFVHPGSLTDREARCRSTTIYLADRRYDMLPAILSANLCSLISGKDRYAVSVMWELTPQFEVVKVWYGRTVIHSQYKLFYEMAQRICDGCSRQDIVDNVPELQAAQGKELTRRVKELRWCLRKLTELGRSLKARRTHGGALELESVEVQIQLTETKGVEDLTPKEHLEVHETIAECMIFANHWVAKKIAEVFPSKALLRNHPSPRQEQFENLLKCAAARGFSINTTSNKALAASLDACSDAKDPWVNPLLRSLATLAMSNARYFCTGATHPDQFSHYGLALDLYTHFTSPIRRYADVVVHRLLLAAVQAEEGREEGDVPVLPGSGEMEDMSHHMNAKHRAAQNAQRDSQELFQSIFFRDHEDIEDVCTADAVIYQLRSNGVFVFVPRYGVKGVAYLQDRKGQVLYVPGSGGPQWLSGSLTCADQGLTVECSLGQQTYHLLEHVTVRLSVNASRAHCQSLKMEVVSKQPHNPGGHDPAEVTTKADIVKRVKQGAERQQGDEDLCDLDRVDPELAQYRQPDPKKSLYQLFLSFHEMGLRCKPQTPS
ncbi:DIS3-like exonuclease 1 [Babylonia areolata]|uniref:DIS3-like exonuclease 1 n=1 Tax=Babylonia areolata TaxID=304850 RepID=UPI003FCFA26F